MSGRPPKFNEPSRPVTVTLPERVLDQLREIDADRAKAIVKAVDGAARDHSAAPLRIQVVEMAPGTGLLVVPSTALLSKIPWLKLIRIAPARYLLAFHSGTSIEKVEVALLDLIEEARVTAPRELEMLELLREKFATLRREEKVSKAEVLLVEL